MRGGDRCGEDALDAPDNAAVLYQQYDLSGKVCVGSGDIAEVMHRDYLAA